MKKVAYIDNKKTNNNAIERTVVVTPLSDAVQLNLYKKLAAQLDTSTLINRFYDWLKEQLPVSGLQFVHAEAALAFNFGRQANNSCHYVLRLQKTYLGEVTITSRKALTEDQMAQQEQAMGILSQHLRTALNHQALEKLAFRDALTGILNRTALDELLPREVLRAQRYGHKLSVAMIDMDKFKEINDKHGHLSGDEVLRAITQAISAKLRRSDLAFRYGGDEFMLLLPGTDIEGTRIVAQQVIDSLPSISLSDGTETIKPRLSIGITQYQQGDSAQDLTRRADQALYEAKRTGRGRMCELKP